MVIAESDPHGNEGDQLGEAYFLRGLIHALEKTYRRQFEISLDPLPSFRIDQKYTKQERLRLTVREKRRRLNVTAKKRITAGRNHRNDNNTMNRLHQVLLICTFLPLCWLAMMAVHELGHVGRCGCHGRDSRKSRPSSTDNLPNRRIAQSLPAFRRLGWANRWRPCCHHLFDCESRQIQVGVLASILRGLLLDCQWGLHRDWIVRQDWRCGGHAAARKPDLVPLAVWSGLFSPRAVPLERPRPTLRPWHSRRQSRSSCGLRFLRLLLLTVIAEFALSPR